MGIRARLALNPLVLLLLLSGCKRSEVQRARQAMQLVQTMGAELRSAASESARSFTDRTDFEDLRRAFGDERFDAGTPLGPDFQGYLATMVRGLELQLEKEPKDATFLRKAARQARQFNQWWTFVRHQLEVRRDQLAHGPTGNEAQHLLRTRMGRESVLAVLAETIRVIGTFEAITLRCVRGIEGILTES